MKKQFQKLSKITILIIVIVFGMPISSSLHIDSIKTDNPITSDNTFYVGGSGSNNYTKIQEAINDSSDGDTVFVFDDSSPYFENIIINKSINLLGEKRHTTIIDGNQLGNVVEINSNYVNISKFTIRNCSSGYSAGIWGSTNYSTISNNNIISNNWSGLVIKNSHCNKIIGNIVDSNRWLGIYLGTCNYNIVSSNIITSNFNEGFFLYNSHDNTISRNFFSENENGIYITKFCSDNLISSNVLMFNEYGIHFIESYGNNSIKNNSIRWNRYGLCLEYSYSNLIVNNNFIRNVLNAHFDRYYLDENRTNYWNGNFWNRPRILPKIILGTLWTYGPFQWEFDLEIDRNPTFFPNRIGIRDG